MTVGAGRRLKQTSALFYWERRRGYRYNLYLPLQGSGGKDAFRRAVRRERMDVETAGGFGREGGFARLSKRKIVTP